MIYYLPNNEYIYDNQFKGNNESFKKDNIRKTSATNITNKKTNPKQLIQSQSVLQRALKALRCFCCAVTSLIRLARNAV
jgi:hypothetical protein